jgi:hypothetical protein
MSRGAKPGERRGGRAVGTPNKKTVEAKTLQSRTAPRPTWNGKVTSTELARSYTTLAIEALAKIVAYGQSESAIATAAGALLDRGWGKSAMAEGMPPARAPLPDEAPCMTVDPLIKPNGHGGVTSLSDFRKVR